MESPTAEVSVFVPHSDNPGVLLVELSTSSWAVPSGE